MDQWSLLLVALVGAALWSRKGNDVHTRVTGRSIATAYGIAPALGAQVVNVARAINADPNDLAALIQFESAGSWSPSVVNQVSGASGLIQFLPSTAAELLGMSDHEAAIQRVRQMDAVDQMGLVKRYLERWIDGDAPTTLQVLSMSVFYPRFRYVAPSTVFPANVQRVNPGITTVQSYVDKVARRRRLLAPDPLDVEAS